jgi:endonuclease G
VDPMAHDGLMSLAQIGYHRLIAEPYKIREGESMTLIQHPGGERRQYAIRENQLLKILDQFLWYQSDTAPGSSGAPAFNDSFQVVALHHSGTPRRDEATGRYVLRDGSTVSSIEGIDDSKIDWIANEGLRISVLCSYLHANLPSDKPFARQLFESMGGGDVMSVVLGRKVSQKPMSGESLSASPSPVSGVLTIPLQLQVSVSMGEMPPAPAAHDAHNLLASAVQPAPSVPLEALRYPKVDRDYSTRTGYQVDFLGVPAYLPEVTDKDLVSKMADGKWEIPYEHFTIVLNKKRRLPLFTASNVDYSQPKRRPEPGEYTRKALSGLGPHDMEKWFTDPRIPQQDQLPDVFYTEDGGSFDKGHVVRREDMCWGDSRDQIVRANGDTFHVTNCTPQVKGFNRSDEGEDNWGDLENEIQKQGKVEKLSIMAGPILSESDKVFDGRDDLGPVRIQIPRQFWKVVLAKDNEKLAAYAFVLQQDLQDVPLEFSVTATWRPYLISLAALEGQLTGIKFPPELHAADRSSDTGPELARAIGAGIHSSLVGHDVQP